MRESVYRGRCHPFWHQSTGVMAAAILVFWKMIAPVGVLHWSLRVHFCLVRLTDLGSKVELPVAASVLAPGDRFHQENPPMPVLL